MTSRERVLAAIDHREPDKVPIDILASGGGFVFSQVHNILPNVPPEHIVAMSEAVKKYRREAGI